MNKKLLTRIGYICIGIAILLFSLNIFMEMKFQIQKKQTEERNNQLLDLALEKGDMQYCKEHRHTHTCMLHVAITHGSFEQCSEVDAGFLSQITCEAFAMRDVEHCETLESYMLVRSCRIDYEEMINT